MLLGSSATTQRITWLSSDRKRYAVCRKRDYYFGIPKSQPYHRQYLRISIAESVSNAAQSLGSFGVGRFGNPKA